MPNRARLSVAGLLGFAIATAVVPQAASAAPKVAYQKTAEALVCDKGFCNVVFPKVANGKVLTLLFASCSLQGTELEVGEALLGIGNARRPPNVFLNGTVRNTGATEFFTVSQPVVFTIPGGSRPNIKLFFGGTIGPAAKCSLSGEITTP